MSYAHTPRKEHSWEGSSIRSVQTTAGRCGPSAALPDTPSFLLPSPSPYRHAPATIPPSPAHPGRSERPDPCPRRGPRQRLQHSRMLPTREEQRLLFPWCHRLVRRPWPCWPWSLCPCVPSCVPAPTTLPPHPLVAQAIRSASAQPKSRARAESRIIGRWVACARPA